VEEKGLKRRCRQFTDMIDVKRHFSDIHELDLDDAVNSRRHVAMISRVHECEICGHGMLYTVKTIQSHLKGVHGLSLGSYYKQFKTEIERRSVDLAITDPALMDKLQKPRSLPKSKNV
jgi:hypothetical protein